MAKHVDYYVSLNSPWTYLGSKRFEEIVKKHNAHVTIWPVDFGSVFAVSGGLPLPKRAPQRQAYRMMELKRWRDHLGVKLNLEPKFFPANEVPAAKCVIALRELSPHGRRRQAARTRCSPRCGPRRRTPAIPATLREIIARLRPRRRPRARRRAKRPAWQRSASPTPSSPSTAACSARHPS